MMTNLLQVETNPKAERRNHLQVQKVLSCGKSCPAEDTIEMVQSPQLAAKIEKDNSPPSLVKNFTIGSSSIEKL